MTKADKVLIADVIREMLGRNELTLNREMAEEASRRLGKTVEDKDISRVRSEIGLNSYQLAEQNATRDLMSAVDEVLFHRLRRFAPQEETRHTPPKHPALKPIPKRYKDLLYKDASYFEAEVFKAATDNSGPVTLSIADLPFEPDLIYACLWYAANYGVEVRILPPVNEQNSAYGV